MKTKLDDLIRLKAALIAKTQALWGLLSGMTYTAIQVLAKDLSSEGSATLVKAYRASDGSMLGSLSQEDVDILLEKVADENFDGCIGCNIEETE